MRTTLSLQLGPTSSLLSSSRGWRISIGDAHRGAIVHLSIFANRHHRIKIKSSSSSSLRGWRHPKRTHPLQMAHRSIFCKLADHHHQLRATHQVDKQAIPHQLRNPFSEPTSDPSNNLAGFLFFNKSPFLVTEGDANIICQPYLSIVQPILSTKSLL